jgi:cell cycle sensor histidine kinase DivJ
MRSVTTFERFWELAGRLAHESVAHPVDRFRHTLFIASKLLLGAIVLAAAPLHLALLGARSDMAVLALGFAMAPLVAVAYAARTGDLRIAGGVAAIGHVGLAAAIATASPGLAGIACALLVLAPIEGFLAACRSLLAAAVAAALLGAAYCGFVLGADSPAFGLGAFLVAALAVLYCAGACLGAMRQSAARIDQATASGARLRSLAAAVDGHALELDRSGAVIAVASPDAALAGLRAGDLAGRGLFERVHVADRPLFLKAISDAGALGRVVAADFRLRAAELDGPAGAAPVFGWTRLRAAPVEERGEVVSIIAFLRDASGDIAHEEELAAAREDAEQTGAAKDRFLASISHELRTPLNAIIGFSEVLGNEGIMPLDAARRSEYAGIIHSSGQHLLSVVNSILDISKMEAGRFDILPEDFALAPVVEQACAMVRLNAEEKAISLRADVPELLPEIVADRRAIKQILINLVSNAVKFTPQNGAVEVRALLRGDRLHIEVEDNGIGVSARDLGRLGDPFFQAHDTYDRGYEGTGLGLSVVRGLVGLHGGSMRIESAPGEGARVTVILPVDCRQARVVGKPASVRIETIPRGPAPHYDGKVKNIA